jgi:Holliday junction resolvasome RuvABC endonuclease subunit
MKTILALDLGTKTGWAYRSVDGTVTAGLWTLQTAAETTEAARLRKDRTLDARIPVLYRKLKNVWETNPSKVGPSNPVDFLVFEDVQFSRFTMQTQLWASMRAAVWLFCYNYNIPRDCCAVGTLKKFGTGAGNADKKQMIEAATKLFPGVEFKLDDNAADALHLLQWAITLTKQSAK